jgi:AhpD family alkylhydroperoxidase
MEKRLNLQQLEPEAYKIMLQFERYLAGTQIKPLHKELLKIRASQINGCAFCLNMHTKDAIKLGENPQRIFVLDAWRDTVFFSEEEQAILALTEEVTLIPSHVSDETYNRALKALGEKTLAQVIMAIVVINSWNRISIATKTLPAAE